MMAVSKCDKLWPPRSRDDAILCQVPWKQSLRQGFLCTYLHCGQASGKGESHLPATTMAAGLDLTGLPNRKESFGRAHGRIEI